MGSSVPAVKVTDNTHTPRVRCPHCKMYSLYTIHLHRMCTQNIVQLIIDSRLEALKLRLKNLHLKAVCILYLLYVSVSIIHYKLVCHSSLARYEQCEVSCLINLLHIIGLILSGKYHLHTHSPRLKCLKQQTIRCNMLS